MPKTKMLTAQEFGLGSFAELLSDRAPIPGETSGSQASFRDALMRSLAPFTPYEMVISENLVAIEWELVQHRRMRDQSLRNGILQDLRKAIIGQCKVEHEVALDVAWEEWCTAGKDQDAFEQAPFDKEAAMARAEDLAQRSVDPDPVIAAAAHAEIEALGIDLLTLMGEAYRTTSRSVIHHELKIQELERRRRSVKADLDALQKVRPIDAELDEAPDAEVLEP